MRHHPVLRHDLTHTITADNGDDNFAMDSGTGTATTAGALDHETNPSDTLTVRAVPAGMPAQRARPSFSPS